MSLQSACLHACLEKIVSVDRQVPGKIEEQHKEQEKEQRDGGDSPRIPKQGAEPYSEDFHETPP